ncbi:MAG: L-threonylcarbamoyladenylate synthase [Candidatus Anstonellales archaeon]
MKTIKLVENWDLALESAKKVLLSDGVVIYPTDTLYGIGGNALKKNVVERIRKMKKRETEKPLSVALGSLSMILHFFEVSEEQTAYLTRYLPGPYTFLLKPKKPMPVSEGLVGVRVPQHFFLTKLIREVGFPVVSTSANISGEKAPARVEEIKKEILKNADLVIDGGPTKYKEGSTVVDLVNKKIIRKGAGEFEF